MRYGRLGSGKRVGEVCTYERLRLYFFFLMIRRPPRSTQSRSSAASDVYKRQVQEANATGAIAQPRFEARIDAAFGPAAFGDL